MAEPENQEIALARELMAGNVAVFEQFVDLIRHKVYQYAVLMCGQREDAEEVVQETLLKVFENFDKLREPEKVRSWVFRIAKNGCLMRKRKSVFAPTHEISIEQGFGESLEGDPMRLEIADWGSVPEDEVLRKELRGVLEQSILQLPEIYKEVLILRDVDQLSTAETAEALNITPESVKTRLHRARLAVREQLDRYLRSPYQKPELAPAG